MADEGAMGRSCRVSLPGLLHTGQEGQAEGRSTEGNAPLVPRAPSRGISVHVRAGEGNTCETCLKPVAWVGCAPQLLSVRCTCDSRASGHALLVRADGSLACWGHAST